MKTVTRSLAKGFLLSNLKFFDYCLSMRVIGTKLPCVSLFGLLSFLPLQSTALSLSRSNTRSRYFTLPRKNFDDPDPEQWLSLKGKKYSRQKTTKTRWKHLSFKVLCFCFREMVKLSSSVINSSENCRSTRHWKRYNLIVWVNEQSAQLCSHKWVLSQDWFKKVSLLRHERDRE